MEEEEGVSVIVVFVLGVDGKGELLEVEGEGVGVVGEEDVGVGGVEVVVDSEEDGEDVFEVEKILDMKIEGVCVGLWWVELRR